MVTPWNVGTLFTHNGRKFRATHFLRIETYALAGDDVGDEILRELLVEEGKDPDNLKRLIYCAPEEATIVCGSGVCGCVVLMSESVVEGMVEWTDELLAQTREAAVGRYGRVAHIPNDTIARLVTP